MEIPARESVRPTLGRLGLAFLALLASCASVKRALVQDVPPTDPGFVASLQEPPGFVRASRDEWVRLTSGEWLRGELESLVRGTLEFDSEELDLLKLDWDDVAAVYTTRNFTLLLEDKTIVIGPISMEGEYVCVESDQGRRILRRGDVQRIVQGFVRERDHWSGKLHWGLTLRRGNTEQTDTTLDLTATRRTAATRFYLDIDLVESSQGGSETANSQRLTSQFDYYMTSRLYLTPLAGEAYRDRFQNIELRIAPHAGVGYTLYDQHRIEWDGSLGLGYRYTRFDTVEAGQARSQESGVAILGTALDADFTEKLELTGSYQALIGLEDLADTDQSLSLDLSYDLWKDLDLDLRISWNRVGKPEANADGNIPEADDLRLDIGLSWSF